MFEWHLNWQMCVLWYWAKERYYNVCNIIYRFVNTNANYRNACHTSVHTYTHAYRHKHKYTALRSRFLTVCNAHTHTHTRIAEFKGVCERKYITPMSHTTMQRVHTLKMKNVLDSLNTICSYEPTHTCIRIRACVRLYVINQNLYSMDRTSVHWTRINSVLTPMVLSLYLPMHMPFFVPPFQWTIRHTVCSHIVCIVVSYE